MCSGSKTKLRPCEMEAEIQQDKKVSSHNPSLNLLELAAIDDLSSFIHEVEEKGCDVNEVSFWYGRNFGSKKMGYEERTPLMIASLYGSTDVLNYLIRTKRVGVNRAYGSDRATALHCAAAGGAWSCVEVVKILLEASGDINAFDVNGKKPCDIIAPCVVKSSFSSKRKVLEMMLNGVRVEDYNEKDEVTEVEINSPKGVKEASEKKEYPIDISMPDINVGIYMTDEFRMYNFKIKPCSRAYSHDWTECPFVHPGENARRRDPRKFHYTCVPCPDFKKGNCPKGDSCEYAHGVFESWLHPAQYRTRLCKDETGCSRKVCFFAHKPEELRPLYASTGSGLPSPKSMGINSLDLTSLSPLNLGSPSLMMSNTSTPPMSPSINCSSPMSSGNLWQSKAINHTQPPTLQLQGSRLKTGLSARDMDLLTLEKIRTQMVDEMANLSSPYARAVNLKPTNLDDVFGSLDPSLLSQLQGLSPKANTNTPNSHLQSPNGIQIRHQNMNQLRASYPSNISSSPVRKSTAFGFDSSSAVAQAVMNSRSAAFAKRSQSFIDRSGGNNYCSTLSGSVNSLMPSKFSGWGSPDGKVDWGFNGHDDANKLRKSASFGIRSGDRTKLPAMDVSEPDVSWVNSLVKDVPFGGGGSGGGGGGGDEAPHWVDQMYIEQEQIFA